MIEDKGLKRIQILGSNIDDRIDDRIKGGGAQVDAGAVPGDRTRDRDGAHDCSHRREQLLLRGSRKRCRTYMQDDSIVTKLAAMLPKLECTSSSL